MSRVITFSRTFPSYHPKKGQPTYFIEKIYNSLYAQKDQDWLFDIAHKVDVDPNITGMKHHTVRAGNRWKAGDWFSPRVWSGKPYHSPQITIAPDIEIKKTIEINITIYRENQSLIFIFNNGVPDCLGLDLMATLAENDGLSFEEFLDWFELNPSIIDENFVGQIICWQDIDYKVCDLCYGTGIYHYGGSFGDSAMSRKCNCKQY